ncbi:unnamed protein product, partial [Pylaiella littoralis]
AERRTSYERRERLAFEGNSSKPPGFSDATSAKGFERIRKRLVGSLTPPFYGGPSPGTLTESNCAVFLEEKMRSTLRTLESGVAQLEKDELVDGGWSTVPDEHTPRRIEMLSEFVQGHLATRDAMDSDEPLEVWSLTGDVQIKRREQVTCTDYLRLLVREQALTSGSRELAETALDAIVRQPNEAWAAAAARVVKVFRATFANADRPCVSETQFFWRFVTEADMRHLFSRLTDVLMPNPFERNGVSSLLLQHTQRVSESMRKLRLELHDPTGVAMVSRGVETQKLFKEFAGVLSAQSVSCRQPARKGVSKQVGSDNMFSLQELSELFASKQSLAAFTAGRVAPMVRDTKVAAVAPLGYIHSVVPEPALELSHPRVAAFQNQVASTPG